jgi:hypothetical protein
MTGTRLWLRAAMLYFLATATQGFRVFDCDHRNVTFEAINLRDPQQCLDPQVDYHEPTPQKIQVLQTGHKRPLTAYRCKITMSQMVSRCGFNSLTYGQAWTVFDEDYTVNEDVCRRAHAKGVVTLDGRVFHVQKNTVTKVNYFSRGKVDSMGHCETEDFISRGQQFYKSYEQTFLTIAVTQLKGTYDETSDTVKFAETLRLDARLGKWRDIEIGFIYWDKPARSCSNSVSNVYRGEATLHRRHLSTMTDSIVMVANSNTSQYGGLVIGENIHLCDLPCYQTQITDVAVCLDDGTLKAEKQFKFQESFDQLVTDLKTQISFLHLDTNLRMTEAFSVVQQNMCELSRSTIHSKLHAAAAASNPYALRDLFGDGHVAYTAGAVVYVAKCIPVEATPRDFTNCTKEIPVSVNGTHYFADPLTYILQRFPSIVPCSDLMPVRWKMGDEWVCAYPAIRKCSDIPQQLSLQFKPLDRQEFTQGLHSGIYTERQRKRHLEFTANYHATQAVTQKVINTAVGNAEGNQPGLLLTLEEETEVIYDAAHYFVPFFGFLGFGWIYLMGALLFFGFVKGVLDLLVRMITMHRERGCGWWLFLAIWDTLFAVLYIPAAAFQATARAVGSGLTYTRGHSTLHSRLYPNLRTTDSSASTDEIPIVKVQGRGKGYDPQAIGYDSRRPPTPPLNNGRRSTPPREQLPPPPMNKIIVNV